MEIEGGLGNPQVGGILLGKQNMCSLVRHEKSTNVGLVQGVGEGHTHFDLQQSPCSNKTIRTLCGRLEILDETPSA